MNSLLQLVLEASIRAAAFAACVGIILALARVRTAAVRHAAWTAVLLAMPLMPLLPRLTPDVRVPIEIPAIAERPATEPAPMAAAPAPVTSGFRAATASERLPEPAVPSHAPVWPIAAVAAYALGALLQLTSLLTGWRAARRLVGQSSGPALPGFQVQQSPAVAVPVTLGVLSPRIVLPAAWPTWPEAKLQAVLAHEAAHVRRRDPLIALAARVNRCVFWFHPLAWWLERKLAATAEQACDEAAVAAVGQTRAYAEVLLDMAEAVRRRGGRLSWQGVAIDGAALERRIDRILRGDLARRTSRRRKAAVAVACAAAIFFVAACRQKSDAALVAQAQQQAREDSERNARLVARQKAYRDRETAARAMTLEQVATLEAAVRKNPDDFDARKKLLDFYHARLNAQFIRTTPTAPSADPMAVKATIAAGLPHAFWLIGHHPEDSDTVRWSQLVFPSPYDPRPDPANLERARKLWLEQADRDGSPAAVYANAFEFFNTIDKPLAEKTLLRAQAADPKAETLNGMGSWTSRLGGFYGRLLSTPWPAPPDGDPGRAFSVQSRGGIDPRSAYAVEVRRKLEQSKDVSLLLWTANFLVGMMQNRPHDPDYDPLAFGKTLVRRALELQPDSTWARQILNMAADQELTASLPRQVWQGSFESRHQAIQSLPEGDRFRELALLAIAEGDQAVRAELAIRSLPAGEQGLHADVVRNDAAAVNTEWQQAAKYAQEALDLAPRARNHPDYGTAFFNANMVLGMAAVKNGDPKTAAQYLLKAADAPATDALKYPIVNSRPWPMNWHFPAALASALLQAGERDAVLAFLEKYARITVSDRGRTLGDIALIRGGKMPAWAQPPAPRN
jgi:beta-lactamase regulating signal transducer with metallopeptidase domain